MRVEKLQEAVGDVAATEQQFLHLEQQVNDFRGGWEKFSEIDYKYSPEYGASFQLETTIRNLGEVSIMSAAPDKRLTSSVVYGNGVNFLRHPDVTNHGEPLNDEVGIEVAATSSTRTVLTRGLPYNFFVKTSLPKRHFLYDRSMRPHVTSHSIDVSADLEKGSAGKDWAFMPESLGFIDEKSGLVFREMKQRPERDEPTLLIPGFALYSTDYCSPDDKSVLSQLIEAYSPNKPLNFLLDSVVGPLQDCWADVLKNRGLLLELHAQNCLFELGDEGLGRVVVRDFQSIFSDREIRSANMLDQMSIDTFEPDQRAKQYSLCYDHFVGRMFIRHLVNDFVSQYPDFDEAMVGKVIAHRFRQSHSGLASEMPKETTFRLAHGPIKINSQPLIETGVPADYR